MRSSGSARTQVHGGTRKARKRVARLVRYDRTDRCAWVKWAGGGNFGHWLLRSFGGHGRKERRSCCLAVRPPAGTGQG
jgi:hypothetical protein